MELIRSSTIGVAAAVAWRTVRPAVLAQSASDGSGAGDNGTLEEVVITAQKRTERLEDVPVSAQVVSRQRARQFQCQRRFGSEQAGAVAEHQRHHQRPRAHGYPRHLQRLKRAGGGCALGRCHHGRRRAGAVGFRHGQQHRGHPERRSAQGPAGNARRQHGRRRHRQLCHLQSDRHLPGRRHAAGHDRPRVSRQRHLSGPIDQWPGFQPVGLRFAPLLSDHQRVLRHQGRASATDGVRAKLLWKITDDIEAKFTYHHGTVQQHGFNFVYTRPAAGRDLLFTPGP